MRQHPVVVALLVLDLFNARLEAQHKASAVQLRYLGTAGWEITDGTTVVLVDPYLSRLRRITPSDTLDPGDTRPLFSDDSIARSDTGTVDSHIRRADYILVTHTHYDHVLDVPALRGERGRR